MNPSNKVLWVDCPHCEKRFNFRDSKFRPFCSERCKLIDLGKWLGESYSVPADGKQLSVEDIERLEQLIYEKESD